MMARQSARTLQWDLRRGSRSSQASNAITSCSVAVPGGGVEVHQWSPLGGRPSQHGPGSFTLRRQHHLFRRQRRWRHDPEYDIICDMIVVLDTNIMVAASLSPFGASFQLLSMVPQRRFEFLLSVPLMFEYEDALKRHNIRQQSHLTLSDIEALLNMLAACGTPRTIYFLWRPRLRDPKDEMVLELAVSGQADAIVTLNARDFLPTAPELFGIEVIRPGPFLRRLQS
jgi:putative PIN family toxin of toxin-antitoxin system